MSPTTDAAPSVPAPLWERVWQAPTHVHHFEALYPLPDTGQVRWPLGVRIKINVDVMYHGQQSFAVAEVFDGAQWQAVASLAPQTMSAARWPHRQAAGYVFDVDGLATDVVRLLEDVRLAYRHRVNM